MREYENTDIWEYLKLMAEGKDVSAIVEKIAKKYEGQDIDQLPIPYEMTKLVESIKAEPDYVDFMTFFDSLDVEMQLAAYLAGLDTYF